MVFLFWIASIVGVWLATAWGAMLFVGNLHIWNPDIPTMGFNTAAGVVLPVLFILVPMLLSSVPRD